MRTEAGKMPESLIFLTENSPGVSNDRFGFMTVWDFYKKILHNYRLWVVCFREKSYLRIAVGLENLLNKKKRSVHKNNCLRKYLKDFKGKEEAVSRFPSACRKKRDIPGNLDCLLVF